MKEIFMIDRMMKKRSDNQNSNDTNSKSFEVD